ncbi:plant intracellular Ras-group-related LRR protein 4-like [Cryptomeria japonica]|uniref:plant intracellular Ras-group-related LRR protein 4-like n=1 Tax=Cryptomeria japonica TaxID=3369 RepID=UPI0027DA4CB3|nr:plant intracellular Ras-group-related LRR protein 4-like [Cryptomeria japonica]
MGCLKHLVCLRLRSIPIKRLPNSVTALRNLQILDPYGSGITELPSSISKLTSLKNLDVSSCEHLQCMPYGISQLMSSVYLDAKNSPNIRWNKYRRDGLLINDLGTLNQLKRLGLINNGEIIREGILGTMKQMKSLHLSLADMESLSQDIAAMSKLRKLFLSCP